MRCFEWVHADVERWRQGDRVRDGGVGDGKEAKRSRPQLGDGIQVCKHAIQPVQVLLRAGLVCHNVLWGSTERGGVERRSKFVVAALKFVGFTADCRFIDADDWGSEPRGSSPEQCRERCFWFGKEGVEVSLDLWKPACDILCCVGT